MTRPRGRDVDSTPVAGHWTVELQTLRPVSAGAVVWRMDGSLCLTVIAKATFGLVPDGTARLVAPAPLSEEDLFRGNSPSASIAQASDLAPYRPRVDVTFAGHAYTPDHKPAPALAVRLSVLGEEASLEKTLHVHGDRSDVGTRPQPFERMPLVWERAVADPDLNPVGVVAGGARMPNFVDPVDPARPAGFGPLAPHWGARARHLQHGAPERRGSTLSVPNGLDWSFYQAAPIDQQLPSLRGDEQLILDNLLPSTPRLSTRLPGARAVARLFGADSPASGFPLELEADTLVIEGDRQVCSIVWRGCLSIVGQEGDLSQLTAVLGIELPGYPMPWEPALPRVHAVGGPAGAEAAEETTASSARGGGSTVAFSPEEAQRLIAASGLKAPPMPGFGKETAAAAPAMLEPLEDSQGSDASEDTTAVAPVLPPTAPAPPQTPAPAPRGASGKTRALSPEEAASLLKSAPRPPSLPDLVPPPGFGPPITIGDEDSVTSLIRPEGAGRPSADSEPPDSDTGGTLAISPEDAGLLFDKPVMPFHAADPQAQPELEPLQRSETLVIEIPVPPGKPR